MADENATLIDYLYGGVNHSLAGNGGPDCVGYISNAQRTAESVLLVPIFIYVTVYAAQRIPRHTNTLQLTCMAHDRVGS